MPHNKPDDVSFALCHIGKGTFFSEHLRIVAQNVLSFSVNGQSKKLS